METNRVFSVNSAQGYYKRVLCVCSAGLLRSSTMAFVLSQEPFNFNTRSAGTVESYALIKVDYSLLEWADYAILCAEYEHKKYIERCLKGYGLTRNVYSLGITDDYDYRDPALISLIIDKVENLLTY